ncbi:MAG: peptide chain release factor N(5)-glutamine methyltransferase [Defluviitaleaceae bacterium]|nr:peptide chain release factor N(5)-glutamine methyltransferase [Defluviitaleaceae bacterium]
MLWDETVPRHEVLLLLTHITGKTRAEILTNANPSMPDDQYRAFLNALERRRNGEPLQYIIGEWDFYGLAFKTDKRALIPRPETECLTEAVIKETVNKPFSRILDVCTGGGCIAVTLAVLTDAQVTAVDICPDALSLANENAALHGVGDRIRFIRSDLAEGLHSGQSFDIVVSNPPYILTGELAELQTEVRDYEPRRALDGGADGMDLYRRLLPQAYRLLKPGGVLFMEIGPAEVKKITAEAGFSGIRLYKDNAGLDRYIRAVK